jgi:hypothetical protein
MPLPTIALALLLVVIYFILSLRPKTNSGRLTGIRKASLICVALLAACLPVAAHDFFGFLLGWHRFLSADVCRVVVLQKVFASAKEMPPGLFWLWVVQQGFVFFAGIMLLRLFWLYSKGIIFTQKNTTCIRLQGYCLIIITFVDIEMHPFIQDSSVNVTPIIYGLLIIFIAWIMDEGRKIQEEQELTV